MALITLGTYEAAQTEPVLPTLSRGQGSEVAPDVTQPSHQPAVQTISDAQMKQWLQGHEQEVHWIDSDMFDWNCWVWRRVASNFWVGEWTGAARN